MYSSSIGGSVEHIEIKAKMEFNNVFNKEKRERVCYVGGSSILWTGSGELNQEIL